MLSSIILCNADISKYNYSTTTMDTVSLRNIKRSIKTKIESRWRNFSHQYLQITHRSHKSSRRSRFKTSRFSFARLLEGVSHWGTDRRTETDRWARSQPPLPLARLIIHHYFIAWPMFKPQLIPQSFVALCSWSCVALCCGGRPRGGQSGF